ncbi:hypothetical protein AB3Y40_15120 [Yoonia sp. R2331]|uniref:hypothetical protein n=1 Tax=Yoonia sp. R2331 TaxID=3237238 RepID=UPI0034E449BF
MLCSVGIGALAQATDSNPSLLRLSAGAEFGDDNLLFSRANLQINRATRTQQFRFSADAKIAEISEADSNFGIISPRVRLSYAQQSGPVSFNVGYSYASDDIDGLAVLDDPDLLLDEDSFVTTRGTRTQHTGSLGAEYGESGPFGVRIDLGFTDLSYDDIGSAALFDNTVRTTDLALRFDVTRVFSVNATLGYSVDDRQDTLSTYQVRRDASIGVGANVNRVTTAEATVSFSEIETEIDDGTGGRSSVTDDGFGFDLGLTIAQRGGESRFAYSRSVDIGGADDRLTYSRTSELTKTQSLSYTIGAIKQGDDVSFLGNVNFAQQLRNGQISVRGSQDGFVTNEGTRAIARQLRASYSTELTSTSSVTFAASLASLDYNDAAVDDGSSAGASVTYRHELTRDWDVSATVSHSVTKEGDAEDGDTSLSVSLNRDFELFR